MNILKAKLLFYKPFNLVLIAYGSNDTKIDLSYLLRNARFKQV